MLPPGSLSKNSIMKYVCPKYQGTGEDAVRGPMLSCRGPAGKQPHVRCSWATLVAFLNEPGNIYQDEGVLSEA